MQSWRLDEVTWRERDGHASARLVKDAETGAEAILVRYPPGSVTGPHVHPCAHGLVVIAGQLATQGGTFGPGDVVWYEEGEVGWHGAASEASATVLLFTNKAFAITWLQK